MKKKLLIALVWVLAVGFLLSLMPWHRNISVQTTAYEYALDQEQPLRTHEVTIEGKFFPCLWRESYFEGSIQVSGYAYSLEEPARVQFWREHDYGLISYRDEAGQPRMRELGHLYCKRDFSAFVIQIFEQETKGSQVHSSWDPESGRILCADAPDYETLREKLTLLDLRFLEG